MNKLFLIIYKNQFLYDLLKEIEFDLQYELVLANDNIEEIINGVNQKNCDYLLLSDKSSVIEDKNKTIIINKPIKIFYLYEKINLFFSKNKYSINSNISIGKYIVDLNSRSIIHDGKNLKLTEKELELILYLKNNNKSEKNSSDIRKNVWGHADGVETHTVETHIYRLRKKITKTFNDSDFIVSKDSGYKII
tara:strand:- start:165 stop:740 length:576 start_codon:yes stop_codon:yes gene_type:complete